MREKFHGSYLVLAGFAEEREIRLTDLAEEGFRFRTAEKTEEPGKFRLCFYNSLAGGYRFFCGRAERGAPPHRAVQPLHPSEADLGADRIRACSLEEQKRRWFSELPVVGYGHRKTGGTLGSISPWRSRRVLAFQ